MYSLIRLIPIRTLLLQQLPTLSLSIAVAEIFYKFHSFTLECLAFLLTWYVVDLFFQLGKRYIRSCIHFRRNGVGNEHNVTVARQKSE